MEKKKQKKNYSAPNCVIVQVNETTNLMDTSFPGQHKPATPGGTISSAKQAPAWQGADNENEDDFSAWED